MKPLGDLLVLIASGAFIPFPFVYHFLTKGDWQKSTWGVHLMVFMAVIAEVMCFADANLLWGPLPPWIRPLMWFQIAVIGYWRLGLAFAAQREDDYEPAER